MDLSAQSRLVGQPAHRAGIDRTYLSALERGIYSASITMVAKLALVLEAEPSQLLANVPKRGRGKD